MSMFRPKTSSRAIFAQRKREPKNLCIFHFLNGEFWKRAIRHARHVSHDHEKTRIPDGLFDPNQLMGSKIFQSLFDVLEGSVGGHFVVRDDLVRNRRRA